MNSMRSELTPFLDGDERLRSFPAKHKKKLLALWYLAGKVEAGRQYTEAELNELLNAWTLFHDPATLRRELYNKRLLERTPDGGRAVSGACRVYRALCLKNFYPVNTGFMSGRRSTRPGCCGQHSDGQKNGAAAK
jgi:hypothetical protein